MEDFMEKALTKAFYLLTIAGLLLGVTAWAYTTFEMKDVAKEWKDLILQRLDRIEIKVDNISRDIKKQGE
jgi:hypothetical protein